MSVSRRVVDVFLRVSIFVCVVAFCLMVVLALFDVGGWALWLPPMIACAGVILSFGVNLNTLHGVTGAPKVTGSVKSEGDPTPPALG